MVDSHSERTPAYLGWTPNDAVPETVARSLLGPGAPFEFDSAADNRVAGFTNRVRTWRDAMRATTLAMPRAPILVTGDREWSYHSASEAIDAVAALLLDEYGIRPGDRVAVAAANSAEYTILLWSVLSIGAIATNLNGYWTPPELEYGISLTEPKLVVGDERRLRKIKEARIPHGTMLAGLDELHDAATRYSGTSPDFPTFSDESAAVILFTSGTTGRPKAATLSHHNLVNYAMAIRLHGAYRPMPASAPPPPRQATIVTAPMFHVSGLVHALITGPMHGTKLVFPAAGAWDPAAQIDLTEKHGITTWSGVPTQLWRLMRHPDLATRDIGSVSRISSGGAVFPPELLRVLAETLPAVTFGNGYGMSESFGIGTLTGGNEFFEHPNTVGRPIPTVEIKIIGTDGALLDEGEVGEICLRSPSVFLGYWNDPAATAAALDADGWYRSGDYGHIRDGLLFLESRRRDLILRGGENIYPIEIENYLVAHPEIDDAAIIGVDDLELGQEVKAFIVRSEGATLSPDQVREWCAQGLASYKIPKEIEFRTSLPYTQTGKLLKQQLEREDAHSRNQ